jgi:hypothetical protein
MRCATARWQASRKTSSLREGRSCAQVRKGQVNSDQSARRCQPQAIYREPKAGGEGGFAAASPYGDASEDATCCYTIGHGSAPE